MCAGVHELPDARSWGHLTAAPYRARSMEMRLDRRSGRMRANCTPACGTALWQYVTGSAPRLRTRTYAFGLRGSAAKWNFHVGPN